MNYYQRFFYTGYTFDSLVGEPDEISSAIGRVVVNFAHLEDTLSAAITFLLGVAEDAGRALTSEMSYKNKVHLYSCLARQKFESGDIPLREEANQIEMLSELTACCFRAEELRNQIVHSSWVPRYFSEKAAERRKTTAKASRGLHTALERLTSGQIIDIADYVIYAAMMIEEYTECELRG